MVTGESYSMARIAVSGSSEAAPAAMITIETDTWE
jgi:hypothetical protein